MLPPVLHGMASRLALRLWRAFVCISPLLAMPAHAGDGAAPPSSCRLESVRVAPGAAPSATWQRARRQLRCDDATLDGDANRVNDDRPAPTVPLGSLLDRVAAPAAPNVLPSDVLLPGNVRRYSEYEGLLHSLRPGQRGPDLIGASRDRLTVSAAYQNLDLRAPARLAGDGVQRDTMNMSLSAKLPSGVSAD
ncbi:MAG TPA: hypothetical protein VFA38_05550, partial [Nitrospirales bacterium]|nr:hypothetical protein [Nitrospirales bacterium]